MKLSQSFGRKENPQVDWKTVVIENRQMVKKGQGPVVSEFEVLWESAMLLGTDIMRDYYSEQKKQLDIRSQLLSIRKKTVDPSELSEISQNLEAKPTYTEENFSLPEGVELSPLLIEYAKEGFDYGIRKILETSDVKVDLEYNQTQSGYTPLQEAALRGHTSCCKVLISAGANIEAKSFPREYTPLVLAAMGNKEETFDYLLACGANLNTHPRGGTILHCANFHLSMIKKLLKLGLPIDHIDASGKTALFKCAENNNVEGSLILIEHGADIFAGVEPHIYGGQYAPVYPIIIRTTEIKYKLALLMKYVVIQSWAKSKFMFLSDSCFKILPRDVRLVISSMLFDYSKVDDELRTKISYRIDVQK